MPKERTEENTNFTGKINEEFVNKINNIIIEQKEKIRIDLIEMLLYKRGTSREELSDPDTLYKKCKSRIKTLIRQKAKEIEKEKEKENILNAEKYRLKTDTGTIEKFTDINDLYEENFKELIMELKTKQIDLGGFKEDIIAKLQLKFEFMIEEEN